jgi:hypothetical protein
MGSSVIERVQRERDQPRQVLDHVRAKRADVVKKMRLDRLLWFGAPERA